MANVVGDPLDRLIAQDAAAAKSAAAGSGKLALTKPSTLPFYRPVTTTPTHIAVGARSRPGSRRYKRSLNQRLLYAVFRRLLDAEGGSENAAAFSVASVPLELASIPHQYSWARLREDEETSVMFCQASEDDGASSSGSSTSTTDSRWSPSAASPQPRSLKAAAAKGSYVIKRLLAKNAIGMEAFVQLLEKILFQEFFYDEAPPHIATVGAADPTTPLDTAITTPTLSGPEATTTTTTDSPQITDNSPSCYSSSGVSGYTSSGPTADHTEAVATTDGSCPSSRDESSPNPGASHYIFELAGCSAPSSPQQQQQQQLQLGSYSPLAARRLTEAQAADAAASLSSSARTFMQKHPRIVLWGLTKLQRCLVHRAAPRLRLCAYSDDQCAACAGTDDWKPLVLACPALLSAPKSPT